jgi:hypothetical protein
MRGGTLAHAGKLYRFDDPLVFWTWLFGYIWIKKCASESGLSEIQTGYPKTSTAWETTI